MESDKPLKKLKTLTKRPVCRVCFKDIKLNSPLEFLSSEPCLCEECFKKMDYHFSNGTIQEVKIMSMAKYGGVISNLLLQYKENLDYELHPVFLSYYAFLFKILFPNYYIVLVPSSLSKMKKRGFNHLYEIFKHTGLPILDVLTKDESKEQKKKNALERRESVNLFHIKPNNPISGKKILLCDDVITSGSSIRACLSLLKKENPKQIKVLVLTNDSDLKNYT